VVAQILDLLERGDSAARAGSRAVESRRRAAEVQSFLHGPLTQHSVKKRPVKNIACAGGVDGVYAIAASKKEPRTVPRERAESADRCAREPAAESLVHHGQCAKEIRFAGEPSGEVT